MMALEQLKSKNTLEMRAEFQVLTELNWQGTGEVPSLELDRKTSVDMREAFPGIELLEPAELSDLTRWLLERAAESSNYKLQLMEANRMIRHIFEREVVHYRTLVALSKIEKAFEPIELLIPARIRKEEIGDALECIERLIRDCAHPWKIKLKIVTTYFWVGINTIRHLTSSLLGKSPSK